MKEFTSQTGGRFTYVDDFLNLQELALAFGEIFTECDNFIVSGCEVSGNSISAGLVYLNGKLRVVEETPSITGGWPQYIYEVNENKNVPYASGGEKIGREVWGARVGKTVPTTLTELTGAVPKAIQINATGGLRMKDAWFGKYALLLNPAASSQAVKGTVNLQTLNVSGIINGSSQYTLRTAGGVGSVYFSGTNLIFEGLFSGAKRIQMVFENATNSVKFITNGIQVASIRDTGIVFTRPLTLSKANVGNVVVTGSDLYNGSTTGDTGMLNINMVGYAGGTSYARTTCIGDGKGNAMLTLSGKEHTIKANGQFIIEDNETVPMIIRANTTKSNSALVQYVVWQDVNEAAIASLGYRDNTNMDFSLINHIGNVVIAGSTYVNIGPEIRESGVPLSEKYALQKTMTTELAKKANATEVYAKTDTYSSVQCDQKFSTKAGGFTQFIAGSNTAAVLCAQIGAIRQDALSDFVQKSKLLADMATTAAAKETIRKNIGAAAAEDVQKDSLWVQITGSPNLYIRQIGNIVSIQGAITTMHSGTAFRIPNNIDPPRYAVGYDAAMPDGYYWSCQIKGLSKECTVQRCNHHGITIPISITYMT